MIEFFLSIQFCNVQIAHFDKNKGSIPFLERIRIEPKTIKVMITRNTVSKRGAIKGIIVTCPSELSTDKLYLLIWT